MTPDALDYPAVLDAVEAEIDAAIAEDEQLAAARLKPEAANDERGQP